jgi:hypothetical protein
MIKPGEKVRCETVTGKIYVGKCVSIEGPHTMVLEDAAWVAETGRLHAFVRDGRAEGMEVEPVGTICVHWAECAPWKHRLFKEAV